jgi:hypothetical protein
MSSAPPAPQVAVVDVRPTRVVLPVLRVGEHGVDVREVAEHGRAAPAARDEVRPLGLARGSSHSSPRRSGSRAATPAHPPRCRRVDRVELIEPGEDLRSPCLHARRALRGIGDARQGGRRTPGRGAGQGHRGRPSERDPPRRASTAPARRRSAVASGRRRRGSRRRRPGRRRRGTRARRCSRAAAEPVAAEGDDEERRRERDRGGEQRAARARRPSRQRDVCVTGPGVSCP